MDELKENAVHVVLIRNLLRRALYDHNHEVYTLTGFISCAEIEAIIAATNALEATIGQEKATP